MPARFNRHVPALCAVCDRPLSVNERRACEFDPEMVCSWHAYMRFRDELDRRVDAFWISEASPEPTNPLNQHVVVEVNPWTFYGYDDDGET